jgi:hypothetical protein
MRSWNTRAAAAAPTPIMIKNPASFRIVRRPLGADVSSTNHGAGLTGWSGGLVTGSSCSRRATKVGSSTQGLDVEAMRRRALRFWCRSKMRSSVKLIAGDAQKCQRRTKFVFRFDVTTGEETDGSNALSQMGSAKHPSSC